MRNYLLLFFSLVCISGNAATIDDLTFSLHSSGTKYGVTDCNEYAEGSLVIPSSYNGLPVTWIGADSFSWCFYLTEITLPDTIESINNGAFYSCNNLESINIPKNVINFGTNIFYDCHKVEVTLENASMDLSLTDYDQWRHRIVAISIPEGTTEIADNAFRNATNVSTSSISIPDSVTSIGENAFYNIPSITDVNIPGSVTSIGFAAFSNCISLANLTLAEGLISIESKAFEQCRSLTNITIPKSVTSIGASALSNCLKLTEITFEGAPPAFQLNTLTNTSSTPIIYYKAFPSAYEVYKDVYGLPLVYLGPPTIELQPQGAIGILGENVNLSVIASDVQGSELTYQWMRNGLNISGETSDTIIINSISASDSGSYQVKVSNNQGSTLSEAANIIIETQQLYTQQQYDEALNSGYNLGFQSGQSAQIEGLYTEEDLEDLRAGSVLIESNADNTATLSLQIERSNDLDTWTSHADDLIEVNMPITDNIEFYRFKMVD